MTDPSVTIAGSLWSVPASRRHAAVKELQAHGLRRLHWDTTDGKFAQAGGFSAGEARELIELTGTSAEAHIMTEEPQHGLDAWAELCDTVVVHVETDGWRAAVDRLERRGCRPALAISPQTNPSAVPADLAVLCMSVTPGHAGSTFDTNVFDMVAALHDASPDRLIGLDGGVTRAHADRAIAAGVRWLVVGTDLFSAGGAQRWNDLLGSPDSPTA